MLLSKFCRLQPGRLLVFLFSVAAFSAYPARAGLFFEYELSYKNFTIYTNDDSVVAAETELHRILDEVERKLSHSPIYTPSVHHTIYLCADHTEFGVFAPLQPEAFAVTYPVLNQTVVNKADVHQDAVRRKVASSIDRSLSTVIAHERTHALLNEEFGTVAQLLAPHWKKEGYCDYIANREADSIERTKISLSLPKEGTETKDDAARYELAVTYLLEIENISIEELFAREYSFEEIVQKATSYYHRRQL